MSQQRKKKKHLQLKFVFGIVLKHCCPKALLYMGAGRSSQVQEEDYFVAVVLTYANAIHFSCVWWNRTKVYRCSQVNNKLPYEGSRGSGADLSSLVTSDKIQGNSMEL